MPILFIESRESKINLGVWKIEEDEEFFSSELTDSMRLALGEMKGRRRIEYLASRHLLRNLLGAETEVMLSKDEFGKPYLEDQPQTFVSLSHTRGYAAAVVGSQPVGIDIQVPVAKITRIAHKFIAPREYGDSLDQLTLEEMHLYWGAKESMFKIYGRKQMDFCQDLFVSQLDLASGKGIGEVQKADFKRQVALTFQVTDDFILVTGVLNPPTI